MRNLLVAMILLTIAATADATPPRTLSYQGVLTDNGGTIVADGTYTMQFRIYDVSSGGTLLWGELQNVAVASGRFDVILGSVNPMSILDFDVPYWLSLKVGTDPEMTPRTELAGAPYSQIARTVEDNAITSSKISSNTVVRSLNGVEDNVNIIAGTNVTVTPIGNDIQISSSGGGGGNPPGIASAIGVTSGTLTGPGTIDNLASRTINCPAAGYVLAIASCHVFVNHVTGNPTYVTIGTSDESTAIPTNQTMIVQIPFSTASGLFTVPLTSHGVYSVSAGNNTFYMLGELGSSNGTASAGDRTLTLVYFQTNYGTVSSQILTDPELSSQAIPGGDPATRDATTVATNKDVERELADLRARLATLEARLKDE